MPFSRCVPVFAPLTPRVALFIGSQNGSARVKAEEILQHEARPLEGSIGACDYQQGGIRRASIPSRTQVSAAVRTSSRVLCPPWLCTGTPQRCGRQWKHQCPRLARTTPFGQAPKRETVLLILSWEAWPQTVSLGARDDVLRLGRTRAKEKGNCLS